MKIKDINCEYAKQWALENNQNERLNNACDDFGKGLEAILIEAFVWYKSPQRKDFWDYVDCNNPTTEELKEKFPDVYKDIKIKEFPFKVGDRISPYDLTTSPREILYIDYERKGFLFERINDLAKGWDYFSRTKWILKKEENPKDLSGVFEYVTVSYKEGIKVSVCRGDKEHFEAHKEKNKDKGIEVLTLEEARERKLEI